MSGCCVFTATVVALLHPNKCDGFRNGKREKVTYGMFKRFVAKGNGFVKYSLITADL